jgi:plastocyanin
MEAVVNTGTRLLAAHAIAAAALVALVACGGGGGGTPTNPGPGGGSPGPSGATVTIANGRVTPTNVTISVGQSVTFVNNNGKSQNMTSDPHPEHNACPPMNAVGNIGNGQTKLTNAFTTARTCGFHDHDDPDNAQLRGSIVIQ